MSKKSILVVALLVSSATTALPEEILPSSDVVLNEYLEALEENESFSSFFDEKGPNLDVDTGLNPEYNYLIKKMNRPQFFDKTRGYGIVEAAIQVPDLAPEQHRTLWHSIVQAALLQKWANGTILMPIGHANLLKQIGSPAKLMYAGAGIFAASGIGLGTFLSLAGSKYERTKSFLGGFGLPTLVGLLIFGPLALVMNKEKHRVLAQINGNILNLITLILEYGSHMPAELKEIVLTYLNKVMKTESMSKRAALLQRLYVTVRRNSALSW